MRGAVHYAPGDRALCGSDCPGGALTGNPDDVTGCADCLELAAEDLADHNEYGGRCLHCRREITAQGGVAWRRRCAPPVLTAGRPGGRLVVLPAAEMNRSISPRKRCHTP